LNLRASKPLRVIRAKKNTCPIKAHSILGTMFALKRSSLRLTTQHHMWSRIRQLATSASLTDDGVKLKGHIFPFRWLRDSCQCPQCVHPSTQQKLHRTSDVELDVSPPLARDGVQVTDDGVRITWAPNHESFYPSSFLERYSSYSSRRAFHADVDPLPWNNQQIKESSSLFVSYDSLRQPTGLFTAMTQLVQYGLLFVTGVPNQKTSTDEAELRKLSAYFGELRETFYGPLWDVINLRNSTNIAYTNLNLDLHMDLL
jgi:gamma-butyrobetaine dioxygenase